MRAVGLAGEFLLCTGSAPDSDGVKTSVFQSSRPVAESKQSARNDGPASALVMPVVRKICPRLTTGDDQPEPGTDCFHATFFVVDHSSGRPVADACPWPLGPRNSGQSPIELPGAADFVALGCAPDAIATKALRRMSARPIRPLNRHEDRVSGRVPLDELRQYRT